MKIGILQKDGYCGLAAVYGQDWIEIPAALKALGEQPAEELQDFIVMYGKRIPELSSGFEYLLKSGKLTVHTLEDAVYLPPIPSEPKLMTLRGNSALFTRVIKLRMPKEPCMDVRFSYNLVGHNHTFEVNEEFVFGGWNYEMVAVIGDVTCDVNPENVYDHIFGYTNMLDNIGRPKSFPFHDGYRWGIPDNEKVNADFSFAETTNSNTLVPTPVGPFIVTKDEIPDPHKLMMEERESGRLVSVCPTYAVLCPFPEAISYLSAFTTLYPGDMLSTASIGYDGYPAYVDKFPENAYFQGKIAEIGALRINIVDNRDL